ncbi:MAG: class II aldolase/adducin family protein [Synergistaceae bacterium]|nr:class II aldolase/adducin family protein [Synergistaceae bacterium]
MREYYDERKAVAYFMRRLYERGLTTSLGGNISFRIGNIVLITPAKADKGRLTPEQIGIVSMESENLTPDIKLSIETDMHLGVLRNRSDVAAVIHAHPTIATFFTIANVEIDTKLTSEAFAILGVPLKAKYELMGTKQLAYSVSQAALKSNVVLMENHGVLTVGKDLLEAFNRMEVLESIAKINCILMSGLNCAKTLTLQNLEEIVKK